MTLRAHPRSRGENRLIHWPTRTLVGASPLTRGKLAGRHARRYAHGRIPAHAGKTFLLVVREIETGAHPRSRGENTRQISSVAWAMGASPLTRGKLRGLDEGSELPGRIPAHAGKTARALVLLAGCGAHPRSRGENSCGSRTTWTGPGASPLTRGKPLGGTPGLGDGGRIPAHAGKTGVKSLDGECVWAHPRSRGENAAEETAVDIHLGASPLTRGKPLDGLRLQRVLGRIPAHAGKTIRCSRSRTECGAHPRSRGENVLPGLPGAVCAGASPLTRGKLWPVPEGFAPAGRIPAHAGKT